MNATLIRLIRYGLVGMALNLTGYVIYLVVTWLGPGPKTTMTTLYGIGALMGFFGHRRLAFDYHGGLYSSALRYTLAHLCGYGLNFGLLYLFVDILGYPHQIVQATAIFVVAGFLFLVFNFVVFPQSDGAAKQKG
ncbi:GtrA family protein [Mesorhizobium sp. A623]